MKELYYPWPNLGPGSVAGIYYPVVVIFKDDLDLDLPEAVRCVVSVMTVAAPCRPKLTEDELGFKKESNLLK